MKSFEVFSETAGYISPIQKIINQKYEEVSCGVVEPEPGRLHIDKIIVNKNARNKGIGTKAMQEIIAFAKKNNKMLTLIPSNELGGSIPRLKKFYGRLGFVPNTGRTYKKELNINKRTWYLSD